MDDDRAHASPILSLPPGPLPVDLNSPSLLGVPPVLKALSIREPWAWAIANRYKTVENRGRRVGHRGPIFLHASQTFDHAGYDWIQANFPSIPLPRPNEFQLGGIVGLADISGCVTELDSPWFCGPVGWLMEDAMPLPFIRMKGAVILFDVHVGDLPVEVIDALSLRQAMHHLAPAPCP